MWTELARVHPIELMLVNGLINLPVLYIAFSLAAQTQGRRQRGRRSPLGTSVSLLLVGVLWGGSTLIDRAFALAIAGGGEVDWRSAFEDLAPAVYPFCSAIVLALIRNDLLRAALLLLSVTVAIIFISRLPFHPEFAQLPADDRAMVWFTVTVGALAMAGGAGLMTTCSLAGRAVAVLLVAWGSKLLVYGRISGTVPDVSVLEPSAGLVTPHLVWSVTLLVFAAGVAATFEAVRLARHDTRKATLAISEQRLRILANATHEGIVIHRDGLVEDANDRFVDFVGEALLNGRRVTDFLPEQAEPDGTIDCDDTPCDEVLRRVDGGSLPVETVCTPLDDGRLVTAVRDLSERRDAQERIRFLAENDALTGIMNRRSFDREAAHRIGVLRSTNDAPCLALLMIDLDRFKPVNDSYGHAVGDELLRVLSLRFQGALRSTRGGRAGDVVARIGGDEFAALAWVEHRAEALAMGDRMRALASLPMTIGNVEVSVGASVGIAMAPEDAEEIDPLRHAADIALYAAKHQGRGRTVVFERAMAEEANARLRLESDLRTALQRGEIELHYQVQHDLRAGETVGYEALMRWRHPERGMISPMEFIPIAEETGMIGTLGRWALERAARDFAEFDGHTRVSVNVSPVQFAKSDLRADVAHALEVSGLAPERLEIEVTEQVLIEDTPGTLAVLDELRGMGVPLSLDDFGSGYSSLSYLTRFPFTKIKIDRCFIERMLSDDRSHALVRSILALASSLGLKVTAEGVETQGQLLTLTKGQCDEAQGYLLGKPQPIAEIRDAVEAERAASAYAWGSGRSA